MRILHVKFEKRRHIPLVIAAIVAYAVATANIALNLHHAAHPGGDSIPDMKFTVYNSALYIMNV